MPAIQPIPPFPHTPGDWLHWFRYSRLKAEREHWSRDDLGQVLGVSGRTVGRWETGQSDPTYSDIENLSQCLSLSPLHIEFLCRAFGFQRPERAPDQQAFMTKTRELTESGFPILIMDSLFYIRGWSTFNEVLGEAGSMAQPGVGHLLWQILSSMGSKDADAFSNERLRRWLKVVWLETASMCGTPAYQRMISRLSVVPGFAEAWMSLIDIEHHDSILDSGPAEITLPTGTFREFRTQLFLPPAYHVRQFVPMDDRAKESLAALRQSAAPAPRFSRLTHWSEEDRDLSRPSRVASLAEQLGSEVDEADIVLFSKVFDCMPCTEARRFLKANHVSYVEKDVSEQGNLTELVKQYRLLSVPVLVVKKQTIAGFNKEEYERALGL